MSGTVPTASTSTQQTASSDGQEFCLRWNNHQATIVSILEQQFRNEAFVDVTLAVEGLALRAHKMVLCACSPYFSALLSNTPDKHPIVILRDVGYKDMRALLDFMYRGEVSVSQDCLDRLLKVAESLRIRGLADVSESKTAQGIGKNRGLAQEILQTSQQAPAQQVPPQIPPASPVPPPRSSSSLSVGALQGLHVIAEAAASKRPLLASVGLPSTPPMPVMPPLAIPLSLTPQAGPSSSLSPSIISTPPPVSPGGSSALRKRRGRPRTVSSPTASSTPLALAPESPIVDGGEDSRDRHLSAVEDLSMSSRISEKDFGEPSPDKRARVKQEPDDSSDAGIVVKTEPEDSVSITEGSTPTSDVCCEPDIWMDSNGDEVDEASGLNGIPSTSAAATLDYAVSEVGDGSVTCKLCGEFLPSKMHWYRHKYRVHQIRTYSCKRCNVAFKSKRGLDNHCVVKHHSAPSPSRYQLCPDRVIADEERFVLDIIERVKNECKGTGVDLDRKGYNKHFSHLDGSSSSSGGPVGTSSTACGTDSDLDNSNSN